MSLALWLRTGRTERKLSLGDVARITKIQPRILERLEGGNLDGLPAEVFVRGFIRSFAKCCGLDEVEALTRYTAASQAQATATAPAMPGALGAPPAARAMVDAMSELAPQIARTTSRKIEVVELAASVVASALNEMPAEIPADVVVAPAEIVPEASASIATPESAKPNKKKQRGKKRGKRGTQRSEMATGTPSTPTPIVIEAVVIEAEPVVEAPVVEAPVVEAPVVEAQVVEAPVVETIEAAQVVDHLDPLVEPTDANEDIVATETWQPKMPAATATATPWRRPYAVSTAAASVPTLVIDDADPEHAAQVAEDREAARSVLTNAQRRSFLPPILLDREDRSARQGGLTLAVIILLIAATLTLSYLMRRPSSSGDGVTMNAAETTPERGVG